MVSLINKQLLLTAYAYLFIMEQQGAQQGGEALQLRVEQKENKSLDDLYKEFGDLARRTDIAPPHWKKGMTKERECVQTGIKQLEDLRRKFDEAFPSGDLDALVKQNGKFEKQVIQHWTNIALEKQRRQLQQEQDELLEQLKGEYANEWNLAIEDLRQAAAEKQDAQQQYISKQSDGRAAASANQFLYDKPALSNDLLIHESELPDHFTKVYGLLRKLRTGKEPEQSALQKVRSLKEELKKKVANAPYLTKFIENLDKPTKFCENCTVEQNHAANVKCFICGEGNLQYKKP